MAKRKYKFNAGDTFITSPHKSVKNYIADRVTILELATQPDTGSLGYLVSHLESCCCPHCGQEVSYKDLPPAREHFMAEEVLEQQTIMKL
jgi:hypothetical protein